jgi:TonB family protein
MNRLSASIACAVLLAGCAVEPEKVPPHNAVLPPSIVETQSTHDRDPAYQIRTQPIYPGFEAVYGSGGTTLLLILVGKDGRPLDIKVVSSSGWRNLDWASINATKQWRFWPKIKNGVAVDAYVRVPVNYTNSFKEVDPWPLEYRVATFHVDKTSIPYQTVGEAVAGVAAMAHEPVYTGIGPQLHTYVIYDDKRVMRERWYFTDISTDRAMAVRYRFSGTAKHPVTNVAAICDNVKVCQRRMQSIMAGPVSVRIPTTAP